MYNESKARASENEQCNIDFTDSSEYLNYSNFLRHDIGMNSANGMDYGKLDECLNEHLFSSQKIIDPDIFLMVPKLYTAPATVCMPQNPGKEETKYVLLPGPPKSYEP